MEEGIFDKAQDKLNERLFKVRQKIYEKQKNVKPFRMEPVDKDQQLYVYQNMAPEDVDYAVNKYGRDAVNNWIYECEQLRQRRNKVGGVVKNA